MGIKGDRDRTNFKNFQDNAEQAGIPDLSLRNVAEIDDIVQEIKRGIDEDCGKTMHQNSLLFPGVTNDRN